MQAAGPPQVRERSQPQVAGPRQVDESFQPPQVAGPPQVRERSQPQVAGPRQVNESFQAQVAGPPKVRERSQLQVAGPRQVDESFQLQVDNRSHPQVAGPPQMDDGSQLQIVRPPLIDGSFQPPLADEMSQMSQIPQENERNTALTVKTPLMEERVCRKGLRRRCNDAKYPNLPLLNESLTSFTPSSNIPQLDGENEPEPDSEPNSEPEQNSEPKPEQALNLITEPIPPELEPEPGLNPPLNIVNPMFGFCQGTACSICPDKTTEKIGNYDACFPSTDKSIPGCERIHWHTKNRLCFTASEFKKTKMW